MQNDKKIMISIGKSRKSVNWITQETLWSEFVSRISRPVRTQESHDEYMGLCKSEQDELKDVGGFVGGTLLNGKRRNGSAGERHLVTLDADNLPPGATAETLRAVDSLGCAYAIYSTRKHHGAAPRLRIILPLDEPCDPDEYEPIARKLASVLNISIFDPTTFEPVRLMYWPSTSADGEFVFTYGDNPFLSKDGMLGLYEDWRDASEWPEVPGAAKLRNRSVKRQGNPLDKKGVVGAFCKNFNVLQAVEEFLPGVYEACGEDRLTYTEGSTVGGAVLYENDNFIYSHHATDPAGGRLCNSFDLVRIHKFGSEDDEAKPETPVTNLPSFRAMCEFATGLEGVSRLVTAERYEKAQADFAAEQAPAEEDYSWMGRLQCSPQTGKPQKTIDNVRIVLENDPRLKGRFYHDEFGNRPVVCAPLPWETAPVGNYKTRPWKDEDDSGMRHYMEKAYDITGKEKIYDAMAVHAVTHKRHKVKEYLNSLAWDGVKRLETLLIDYFGAEDTAYTRAVTKKTLVAAVARVMCPGVKFDAMLILSGRQGCGKSTFFRLLGKDWYSDSLATFEGKEAAELIQGYWIIEAGELTGMNKSEMNTVKQFLSKVEDVYREPYGRRTAPFPRSCIIVGTTNEKEYLKDRTGNRRFWPVDLGRRPATKDVFQRLPDEVDRVWAEAVACWQCGEKLYLEGATAEEAVRQQEEHKEVSPREGTIREFVERRVPPDWNRRDLSARRDFWNFGYREQDECLLVERDRVCAAEIWCECLSGDLKLMRRSDTAEINGILSGLPGWEKTPGALKFGSYYGPQRGYVRKVTFQG